jgi:hypothetical protein
VVGYAYVPPSQPAERSASCKRPINLSQSRNIEDWAEYYAQVEEEETAAEIAAEPSVQAEESPAQPAVAATFDPSKLFSIKQKSQSKRKQALMDDISNAVAASSPEKPLTADSTEAAPTNISPKKKQIGLINSKFQEHTKREQTSTADPTTTTSSSIKRSIQSEFAQLGLDAMSPSGAKQPGSTVSVAVPGKGAAALGSTRNAYGKYVKKGKDVAIAAASVGDGDLSGAEESADGVVDAGSKAAQRTPTVTFSSVGRAVPQAQVARQPRISLKPAIPARKVRPAVAAYATGADTAEEVSAAGAEVENVVAASVASVPAAQPSNAASNVRRGVGRTYAPAAAANSAQYSAAGHIKPVPPSLTFKPSIPKRAPRSQPHNPSGGEGGMLASSHSVHSDTAAAPTRGHKEHMEEDEIIPDLMPASILEENSTHLSLLDQRSHADSSSTVKLNAATASDSEETGARRSPVKAQDSPQSNKKARLLHARFAEDDEDGIAAPLSAPTRPPQYTEGQYPHSSRSQPEHNSPSAIKKRPGRAKKQPPRIHPYSSPYYTNPVQPRTKQQLKAGAAPRAKKYHKGKDWMAVSAPAQLLKRKPLCNHLIFCCSPFRRLFTGPHP